MNDDLVLRIQGARPRAVATTPARDRAREAALGAVAPGERRRAARIALAVAGLASAAAVAVAVVAMTLAGGGNPAPRILLPGDTDPAAASAPPAGSVRVPDVVGRGAGEARALLTDLGFRVTAVDGGPVPAGPREVAAQRPDAGTTLPLGERVEIRLREASPALAPEFDIPLLRGDWGFVRGARISSASLRGEVIVLAFTASWCEPCKGLSDVLQRTSAEFGPQGTTVLAVATRDVRREAPKVAPRGSGYAVALDRSGAVSDAYEARALPEVVVIARDGRIAERFHGAVPMEKVLRLVETLVLAPRPGGARVETPVDTAAFDGPPLPPSAVPAWVLSGPCEVYPDRVWKVPGRPRRDGWFIARGPRDQVITMRRRGSQGCSSADDVAEQLARRGVGIWSAQWVDGRGRFEGIVARRVRTAVAEGVRVPVTEGTVLIRTRSRMRLITFETPTGSLRLPVG